MNLTKMRLMLAIADIATLPDILNLADLQEVREWMGKSSTGIAPQVRELLEKAIMAVAEGE